MDDRLIIKIQRLLALANDGRGNENEAAAAMAKAQELLAEHNLTMASVVNAGTKDDRREKAQVEGLKHGNGRGAMYQYQRQLMRAIAEANFCRHWIIESGKQWNGERRVGGIKSHMLVGKDVNVLACKLMFEYLNETMERLVPYQGKLRLSKSGISWKEGCTHRLCQRIADQANQRRAESRRKAQAANSGPSDSKALVPLLEDVEQAERDANYEFMHGLAPGTMKARREAALRQYEEMRKNSAPEEPGKPETEAQRRKREQREQRWHERQQRKEQREWARKDASAYISGFETADDINLDQQVTEAERAKLIK